MKLETNDNVSFIKVEPSETLIVEFHPDWFNAPPTERKRVSVVIGTVEMPGGQMALSIAFPKDKIYRNPNTGAFIVCDIGGYKELLYEWGWGDNIVKLVKVEYPHATDHE